MTAIFDYVDKVIEIELIVPSQMHTKTLRNMRPLENKDSKSRTIVIVYYFLSESLGHFIMAHFYEFKML